MPQAGIRTAQADGMRAWIPAMCTVSWHQRLDWRTPAADIRRSPAEMWNADTELPSRARAVYMYLRDRADSEGKCWPGIKTIASDMRLSRSTVKRALTDLEQHGYLQKIPRYRDNGSSTSNLYSVQ